MTDAETPDEQPEEGRPTDASPPEEAEAADSSPEDSPAEADGPTDASPPEEGDAEEGRAADGESDDDATVPAETETVETDTAETQAAETAAAETEPGPSQQPESPGSAPDQPSESIPGAHLEPDLVLEEPPQTAEPDYSRYADTDTDPEAGLEAEAAAAGDPTAASEPTDREAPTPEPRSALDLAADARYRATGKRKTSVARVILRPGNGTYTVNGRPLEQFFPRTTLQLAARQPLQTAGYEDRMDVVARLHGGGVSAQAGALRHGIARALAEADPALRGELKRHGFLTRDARAKERKKAGLKKARKRPQFSKR